MCRSIKGTAAGKRLRIMDSHKCDEKWIDSELGFLSEIMPFKSPASVADQVIPEPVLPSSSDIDETQVAFSAFSTRTSFIE